MIKNIPDASEMEQTAIRLYFTAWDHVCEVITPLLGYAFSVKLQGRKLVPVGYRTEHDGFLYHETLLEEAISTLDEYLRKAQPDLQLCYALIQQTMEIALKARICAVSPFLLLLGSDIKSWAKTNADFTDFRTIDAGDLVKVVNAVCPVPVSERFGTEFDIIRRGRNKIQHLGSFQDKIDPVAALDILVDCWPNLFVDRKWLSELQNVIENNQSSVGFFDDYNHTTLLLAKVATLGDLTTLKQRKKLFEVQPTARLFKCWRCANSASWHDFGDHSADVSTAYMNRGSKTMHCLACDSVFATNKFRCTEEECEGTVLLTSNDLEGYCATCGVHHELAGPSM